jgi:cell wall-associated NlpC family hydrolase
VKNGSLTVYLRIIVNIFPINRALFASLTAIIIFFWALVLNSCTPSLRYTRPGNATQRSVEYGSGEEEPHNIPKSLSDKALVKPDDQKIISAVDKYLGIPYKWGGEDLAGMDCSGFTRCVFRDAAGLNLPHSAKEQFDLGRKIQLDEIQTGDLIFFNINKITISHVGIYIGNGKFAHASETSGVTTTDLSDKYYTKTFRGARRLF